MHLISICFTPLFSDFDLVTYCKRSDFVVFTYCSLIYVKVFTVVVMDHDRLLAYLFTPAKITVFYPGCKLCISCIAAN